MTDAERIVQEEFDMVMDEVIEERLLIDYSMIPNIYSDILEFYHDEVITRLREKYPDDDDEEE